MRGDSNGKPRVYELALSCHSLIALIAMTLYTVGILKSSEFHTFVCYVCVAMWTTWGLFCRCCFSIRLTEREAVAQNHFVPLTKLFNGIPWGGKKSRDKWGQRVCARTHRHTHPDTFKLLTRTGAWTLDFPYSSLFSPQSQAQVHTHCYVSTI